MSEKYEIKWSKVGNQFVELNSLNDVSISELSDGDQMIYNKSMDRWVNTSYQEELFNQLMEQQKEYVW